MDRLKRLGTWVLLVIAFYLFSNGLIYVCTYNGGLKDTNSNNNQVINKTMNF